MAGLDRPTEGEVLLDGVAIQDLSEDRLAELRRRKVGFVFQNFQLLGNQTARENVLLPLELAGERRAGARADELLAMVGLAERGHHYPVQLSGGEQQRVGPGSRVRDAPGDPARRRADRQSRRRHRSPGSWICSPTSRKEAGTTLVLVTHDRQVARLAGRAVYLRDGRIERDERPIEAGDAGVAPTSREVPA